MESDQLAQRRAHNASIPIGKLPMELLAEIFHLSIVELFPRVEMYLLLENFREVSAHCSRIIFGSPKLWAFTSAQWPLRKNRRALKLSGNHPLRVDTSGENLTDETLGLVLPSSCRWRLARIGVPQDERLLRILKALDAPQLEKLEVSNHGDPIEINLRHPTLLHALEYTSVRNPLLWSSNVLAGLRKLKIETEEDSLPALKVFFVILESSPQLKDLFFSSWSLEDPDAGMILDSSQVPVNMNQLRNAYFDVQCDYMSRILEFVHFPVLVMAEFRWHDMFSAPVINHAAHVKLLSSLPLPPKEPPSKLTIISDRYKFKLSNDHRTVIGDTRQILVSDYREAMSFGNLAKDFAQSLRKERIPWRRPHLHTKWITGRDVNLDEVFHFEEVDLIQGRGLPSRFAEFTAALKNLPASQAQWLFHAMDTLRIYYLDSVTHSMGDLLQAAIREREHCARPETKPLPEESGPKPLKCLILLGPTRPAEEVVAMLSEALCSGYVEWIERHLGPGGYYDDDF